MFQEKIYDCAYGSRQLYLHFSRQNQKVGTPTGHKLQSLELRKGISAKVWNSEGAKGQKRQRFKLQIGLRAKIWHYKKAKVPKFGTAKGHKRTNFEIPKGLKLQSLTLQKDISAKVLNFKRA